MDPTTCVGFITVHLLLYSLVYDPFEIHVGFKFYME